MRPAARLGAFAVVLGLAFGAGAAVGGALPDLGPSPEGGSPAHGRPPGEAPPPEGVATTAVTTAAAGHGEHRP